MTRVHFRHQHFVEPAEQVAQVTRNLGDLLSRFDKVLVPEMNTGQLKTVLRDQYLVPAEGFNLITGKPFKISEIETAINDVLGS